MLLTQPFSQYVVYKPVPTVTLTTHSIYPPIGATFPSGLNYSISPGHSNPVAYPPYTTHYQYVHPQQPPQPLASTAVPKPDISKKEPASVESVQEMLKEFKAELSGQKVDNDKPQEPASNGNAEASSEPDHQKSIDEK